MDALAKLQAKLVVTGAGRGPDSRLDNDDLRPLKVADRTWSFWTYFTFWFSATASVATWYSASVGQKAGLSLWESVFCQLGGQILISIVMALNGRPGATYHIGFPIINRAAFGVYGALFPTLNRAVMAIVWNGVNAVQGGQCLYVMLHAMFPSIAEIRNTMGSGSIIDSGNMVGFVVFWVITCFFLVIPVPKLGIFVYIKLGVFLVSAVAMVAWTVSKAGGLGPVVSQPSAAHGSDKAWLIGRFLMLGATSFATFASNAADFQRYAAKPSDVLVGNLVGFPLSNLIVNIMGNLVAAASQAIYGGEPIWNPMDFLDRMQTEDYTPGNRAGCFFIALCFAYSSVFSCIFENSLPAGNDLAALWPKYITVKRGFFICAVLSFAINPWYLMGSADTFISFLASYQVFLSAITGVLLANYYIIGHGYINIPHCYTANIAGDYYYYHGWNLRAYAAYIIAIAPNFYGFLSNLGVPAPVWVQRMYYFAYWIGIFLSGFFFWVFSICWPPYVTKSGWKEPKNYIRPEEDRAVNNTTSFEVLVLDDLKKPVPSVVVTTTSDTESS